MKSKTKWWCVALTLVICSAALYLYVWAFPREPTYQGRSVTEWLDAATYRDTEWWPGTEATEAAVRALGTNAIPVLLKRVLPVRDAPSKLKDMVSSCLCRLGFRKQANRYYDADGVERWTVAINGVSALKPRANEVVPQLIQIYRESGKQQCAVLSALGHLRAKEAVPFLLGEASNTNAPLRANVFWALAVIGPEAEVVLPLFIKGLRDPAISVRHWSAVGLSKYGPEAKEAIPALKQCLQKLNEARPYQAQNQTQDFYYRMAQSVAESALKSIDVDENQLSFSSKSRLPQNPHGKRPLTQEAQPQNAVEHARTNGPPRHELAFSAAYKYVATGLMLMEANYCAERVRLPTSLPIKESQLRFVYVSPPELMRALGAIDTDEYSFGFGESGRLRFITKLHPFGNEPYTAIQRRLAKVEANMSTNSAFQLATNWLTAIAVDVPALEKKFAGAVRQHFHYENGQQVLLPIFDVLWGDPKKPAVIVTIYAPRSELIQIRQSDESFSGRPPRSLKNLELLLSIPEADFLEYTEAERASLLKESASPPASPGLGP